MSDHRHPPSGAPEVQTDIPDVSLDILPPDYGTGGDGVLEVVHRSDPAGSLFGDLPLIGPPGSAVAPPAAVSPSPSGRRSPERSARYPSASADGGSGSVVPATSSAGPGSPADPPPLPSSPVLDPPGPGVVSPGTGASVPSAISASPAGVGSPLPRAAAPSAHLRGAAVPPGPVSRSAGVDESLQHALGLTRDGQRVDWALEGELLAELEAAGLRLSDVRLRYEELSADERRSYKLFQVQQAFRVVIDKVEDLVRRASTRAEYSFGEHVKLTDALLERFAALQLLTEGLKERFGTLRDDLERRGSDVEARLGVVDRRAAGLDAAVERAHERAAALHQEVLATGEDLGLTAGELRRASFVGAVGGALFGGFVASVVLTGLFLVLR